MPLEAHSPLAQTDQGLSQLGIEVPPHQEAQSPLLHLSKLLFGRLGSTSWPEFTSCHLWSSHELHLRNRAIIGRDFAFLKTNMRY